MPISEEYLVSYLLQETQSRLILWHRSAEDNFDGFLARLNGVRLRLARIDSTTESRLWLHLESDEGSALIPEPRGFGLWGRKYRSDSERAIAELMIRLEVAVTVQNHGQAGSSDTSEQRQAVFRRLIFADEVTD